MKRQFYKKKMKLTEEFNIKKISFLKWENIYLIIFILLIFFLDRFSKNEILKNFSDNNYFVNNYINLDLVWNTGIGFGLFSYDSSLIYGAITALICLIIIFLLYYIIILKRPDNFIFSIIIGGALGNFYDRLFYNAVPDFIDLHYNNFHWFTFNVADIFITFGIISYLVRGYFIKTNK